MNVEAENNWIKLLGNHYYDWKPRMGSKSYSIANVQAILPHLKFTYIVDVIQYIENYGAIDMGQERFGFLKPISECMECQWTHYFLGGKCYIHFESEEDMVRAILII